MLEIGYRRIKTFPRALPHEKKLVQMDFRKQAGADALSAIRRDTGI